MGARPTRQPLQPEATGAFVEGTKRPKPSDACTIYGDREYAGRNMSERRASLEKDNANADPAAIWEGRTAGGSEQTIRTADAPGYWRRHVHKESARNTGSPKAW